jgi:hypothetical protein
MTTPKRTRTTLTALLGTAAVGLSISAVATLASPVSATTATHRDGGTHATQATVTKALLKGSTTGSYFWDDASGRQGDTGMPAIGKPMQKGLFSSPSWPLGTEGYVFYKGKSAKFFIGDRGPGTPSEKGVMLDIDGKTFAELTGGKFDTDELTVKGNGGDGHIKVDYVVTKWGTGHGKKGTPVPFSAGAWND